MNTQYNALSFSLKPLHEKAYELTLHFTGESALNRSFTFVQGTAPLEGAVLDIFTKNGECQNFHPSKPFHKREIKEAKSVKSLLEAYNPKSPKVAVFDLKDINTRYLGDGSSIKKAESSVLDFFQKEKPSLVPANFLLFEGSLKHDFLNRKFSDISEKEIEFLNSREGAVSFCVCAEYLMTAIKMGAFIQGHNPHSYIQGINNTPFTPCQESTTFYPPLYKSSYAIDSPFAQSMIPIFSLKGNFDPKSQVTTLSVVRRK